ncbi:MAG: response regulator transcription factor [Syntrophobacteraceae bacterium]|nr:response regulator transcription factor [Desulfobacteraceae bacterium]
MAPYRIVLADDHVLFREGIKSIVGMLPDLCVAGEAGDGLELLRLLGRITPEMVILDLSMPNLQGVDATREIKQLYPGIKVLILTMHKSREHLSRALSAGADGYLLKEDAYDDLSSAIRSIRQGKVFISPLLADEVQDVLVRKCREPGVTGEVLTAREREVLKLVAEGKSSKEVAQLLHISVMTVHNHRANIRKKLDIKKNVDLIKYALDQGYI